MRPGIVTAWRMRRELGMEIAHRIYLYLVQKYPLGNNYEAYPFSSSEGVILVTLSYVSIINLFQLSKSADNDNVMELQMARSLNF